ncbi:hypothetical protein L1987_87119 [Smallanthus sonchifolius]|nr:hypothetical protein L1987_87119 [Smallanthus sonchifolius]
MPNISELNVEIPELTNVYVSVSVKDKGKAVATDDEDQNPIISNVPLDAPEIDKKLEEEVCWRCRLKPILKIWLNKSRSNKIWMRANIVVKEDDEEIERIVGRKGKEKTTTRMERLKREEETENLKKFL